MRMVKCTKTPVLAIIVIKSVKKRIGINRYHNPQPSWPYQRKCEKRDRIDLAVCLYINPSLSLSIDY